MTRLLTIACLLALVPSVDAGYKVKLIKSKKAEQFQTRFSAAGVTWAADLLFDGGAQKDFFYKELTPSNVIAVRLAVFNNGSGELVLPVEGIQLTGPDGQALDPVAPEAVAAAVLQDKAIAPRGSPDRENPPVAVVPTMTDPRTDPTDPRYDPRLDPNSPRYDPTDPRADPQGRSTYPPGMGRPGVGIVLDPRGGGSGGGGDLSRFERSLVEKDFSDKAHSTDPIDASMVRDRFLFFSVTAKPEGNRGYILKIPKGKGILEDVALKF
jgi:hypothetical protein